MDQNILSDLRARKLQESDNEDLALLKKVLLSPDIQVVYSHITLAEIYQISIHEYKVEHINLLEELNAKYIEPNSKKLSDKKPSQVWIDYIKSINSKDDILGIKNLGIAIENLSRKISGLPIKDSFEEISESLEDSRRSLSKKIIDLLDVNINEDDLKEPYKGNLTQIKNCIELMKEWIPILLNNPQKFDSLSSFDNQPLGPKPFREYEPIKNLKISSLPSSNVVSAIENVLNQENTAPKSINYFDDITENQISKAYSLMNWAGYYPDDFNKIKKHTDRFRASNNDMLHATAACRANFLISDDYAFRMKVIASYEYAKSHTTVCSAKDFLEEHHEPKYISSK